MTTSATLFIDDGGVLSDNARRAEQWPALVGEFMSMRVGGDAEAWAASNRESHLTAVAKVEHLTGDFATWQLAYARAWLTEMGSAVGIAPPARDEAVLTLYQDAHRYITPRVDAAIPGAADAVRALHAAGYTLYTASGETSTELHGYTTALGIRDCFVQLFGPDLVHTFKNTGGSTTSAYSKRQEWTPRTRSSSTTMTGRWNGPPAWARRRYGLDRVATHRWRQPPTLC